MITNKERTFYMIKIIPNNIYRTDVFENWLGEQAKKGNIITDINSFFCVFKNGEKENICYKLIPTGKKDNETLTDKKIAEYKEKNFDYICTYKNHFHIMKTNNTENFCDSFLNEAPQIQKNFKRLISDNYFYMILWIIIFIAVIAFTIYKISANGAWLYNIIKHRKWALSIMTAILSFIFFNKCRLNIQNLKYSMENLTNPHDFKEKDKSFLKYSKSAIITSVSAFVILTGLTVHSMANSWHKNMENIPKTLPILLLNMVEQNPAYHRYNPVAVGDGLVRKTNSAKFSYSLLAPKQYEILQIGIIEDQVFDDSGKLYTPSSNVDFLRATTPSMAKTLYKDLIKTYALKNSDPVPVTDSPFEEAVIYKSGNREAFFGYYNNNAIYVSYYGNKSIMPFAKEIYESIEYLEY